jgi:hypothetical protein
MEEKFKIQMSLVAALTQAALALTGIPGQNSEIATDAHKAVCVLLEAACQKASVLAATVTAVDAAPPSST